MGTQYDQITAEERCAIAGLQAQGRSIRQIATALDRAPSSIARELKRNRGRSVGYQPIYAQEQCRARRWTGSKLERNTALRERVLSWLALGASPEAVAGRLEREHGRKLISHETIYRFIYAQIARTNNYDWRHYLPRRKSKRGYRGGRGGSPAKLMAHRRSLSERPPAADDRKTTGHWEGDLMLFGRTRGPAILTMHERHSRLLLALRTPNKEADSIARLMIGLFASLPPHCRQTITFDNDTAFAYHYRLHTLGIQTFFCDPHAPWQKGGVENAIGRMRRALPRKTDLAAISDPEFLRLISAYNNTPRKCLDFLTPAEVFWKQLLHFKCESSFRPAPE